MIRLGHVTESDDGRLTLCGRTPCGGRTPRSFAISPSGSHLLVGNQDSDTIAVFAIGGDGGLTLLRQQAFPTPVCLCFLKA